MSGGLEVIKELFDPLGYTVDTAVLDETGSRGIYDLRIAASVQLRDLLNHLYVLVPVLDNAKHWWIGEDEIDKLMAKGEGWLADHPAKDLIARRALKHRRKLVHLALTRLSEDVVSEEAEDETARTPAADPEDVLEKPIRLHDLRLDAIVSVLAEHGGKTVLDLGCGEGKLVRRLIKERGITRILGVDPSVRTLESASERLRLGQAGDAIRERVSLQMGSLTYGDRRWQGFDAATLVEVIEHIEPSRLSALELSLFGSARPGLVLITTPNREYNVLFERMAAGSLRHPDHRFEWTRDEFRSWAEAVAARHGYAVDLRPLGPIDETHGAPSQMAAFVRRATSENGE